MTRLKDVAVINRSALPDTADPDLRFRYLDIGSVDGDGHVAPLDEMRFEDAPSRARRLVRPGDTVLSTVRTYLKAIAGVGIDAPQLVVSTGFATLTPQPGVHPRYLTWAVRSASFIDDVVARSVGVSYPAITATELGTVALPLPPIVEQQRIADYIDAETARMDRLVVEQEQQLRLTAERRHALVSAAVRARLGGDPSSLDGALLPLPPSWRLLPLRTLATIQSGLTLGKTYDGPVEQRPYLRVANVQDGSVDLSEVSTIEVPRSVALGCELRAGDVLMTEGGDNDKLGRGTVWQGQIDGCLHQNHIFAVRPDRALLRPHYLALLTASSWGRAYFMATAHQTTNLAATNRAKVGRFPVPLPPLQEQDKMLATIDDEMTQLDLIESELARQVSLLRERRQALITHAVTEGIEGIEGPPGVA